MTSPSIIIGLIFGFPNSSLIGLDEKCFLQSTKKNAVVNVDQENCTFLLVDVNRLHFSIGQPPSAALFYMSTSTNFVLSKLSHMIIYVTEQESCFGLEQCFSTF